MDNRTLISTRFTGYFKYFILPIISVLCVGLIFGMYRLVIYEVYPIAIFLGFIFLYFSWWIVNFSLITRVSIQNDILIIGLKQLEQISISQIVQIKRIPMLHVVTFQTQTGAKKRIFFIENFADIIGILPSSKDSEIMTLIKNKNGLQLIETEITPTNTCAKIIRSKWLKSSVAAFSSSAKTFVLTSSNILLNCSQNKRLAKGNRTGKSYLILTILR